MLPFGVAGPYRLLQDISVLLGRSVARVGQIETRLRVHLLRPEIGVPLMLEVPPSSCHLARMGILPGLRG